MKNKTIKLMYADEIDGDLTEKAVTANGNCTTIYLEDGTIETNCVKPRVNATSPYTKEAFKCEKCGNTKHAPHTWPKYCPMCGAKVAVNQDRR